MSSLRPKMTTDEDVMEPPAIKTKTTTNTKTSAKEREETRLDKEDSGQCENLKDLQGITGGQMLKYNHAYGQIYFDVSQVSHVQVLDKKSEAMPTEFPFNDQQVASRP